MLVLVTEDDEDYAEVIAATLRREAHEVVIAGSVNGAMRFAKTGTPDLAILDVMLPDGSGLDIASSLHESRPEMPIIFLSNLDRASDVVAGLEAGADEYITKPFHPSEFVARVRAVLRRANGAVATQVKPKSLSGQGLEFGEHDNAAYLNGVNLNCTRLEINILRELSAVPGQVLSHAYLNERVWSYSNLREGTLLKGHVSSLRRKLRAAGGDEDMIRTVHGVGYSFTAE